MKSHSSGAIMNEWRGMVAASVGGFMALTLALAGSASSVSAQETDRRWLPWLGCWTSTDAVAEGSDQTLLCVTPTSGAGVELVSVSADGQVIGREPMNGDGVERPLDSEGCEGSHVAEFSTDETRVYVSTVEVCDGGISRASKGVFAMITPYEWVDVQSVEADGEGAAWAMRYRAVSDERAQAAGLGPILEGRQLAARSARIAASRSPDVDDVADVYEHVGSDAAKAWLVETNSPLDLDSDRLVELAETGVPGDVIDVVVAVSYPTRFTVDRGDMVSELADEPGTMYGARSPYVGMYGINRWDPFYYRGYYSPFGYGSSYGYGGYGYGYGGYGYGGYYGYRPTVVQVTPRDDDRMRVVNGRGWTRSQSSTGSGSSSGVTRAPARRSTGSSAGTTAAPSQRSSPGASSSGGGSSSRGSSTGRTARPRGGND